MGQTKGIGFHVQNDDLWLGHLNRHCDRKNDDCFGNVIASKLNQSPPPPPLSLSLPSPYNRWLHILALALLTNSDYKL